VVQKLPWGETGGHADDTEAIERTLALAVRLFDRLVGGGGSAKVVGIDNQMGHRESLSTQALADAVGQFR